ncbi:AraC-like DNA-binding protein [Sphingobium fontiphilum]|uniref:AraC-like DNA-binding protein n=1 Tax=Sphingobium fontiphilum TaxID=944425 RepID=A0A7W6DF59_9SPHN|nr:helix-turn-helix transcriptional regulator [Sphingobium fontiphilum]MBB3981983.1 AraC-like DNA-binding protein [Sphingobium fontiphilum]
MGFDHDGPDLSSDVLQASLDVRSPAVREGLRRIAVEMAQPCLSIRHFFRQFKVATGRTLARYVADRKIERAKQLQRQASPAIKVIAWDCGFDSAAAFSADFRRVTGLTPRQFREGAMHWGQGRFAMALARLRNWVCLSIGLVASNVGPKRRPCSSGHRENGRAGKSVRSQRQGGFGHGRQFGARFRLCPRPGSRRQRRHSLGASRRQE